MSSSGDLTMPVPWSAPLGWPCPVSLLTTWGRMKG